jgi:hypothetical protein
MTCRDWKVVYVAFSFSDGGGYEIGTFNPDFPGELAVDALSDLALMAADCPDIINVEGHVQQYNSTVNSPPYLP